MSVLLALDGYVATPTGPVLVRDLTRGSAVLAIIGGLPTEVTLSDVGAGSHADVVRLLTAVGDIVIPAKECVMTRNGAVPASAVAADAQRDRGPRLEIVNPAEMPHAARRPSLAVSSVLAFVQTLDPPTILLPAPLAEGGLTDEVDSILTTVGVRFERIEDDRWSAFVLEPGAAVPARIRSPDRGAAGSRLAGGAAALLALTAWGWDGEALVSRTRLESTETRRQLISALVYEALPFEAKWTPGYLPVECRIRRPSGARWPPFVGVSAALTEHGPTIRVEMSRPGGLVVGLAVSGPVA